MRVVRTDPPGHEEEGRAHPPGAQCRKRRGEGVLIAVVEGEEDRLVRERRAFVLVLQPIVESDRVEPSAPDRVELGGEGSFTDRELVARGADRVPGEDRDVRTAGRDLQREGQEERDPAEAAHQVTSDTPRFLSRRVSQSPAAAISKFGENAARKAGIPRSASANPRRDMT